MLEEFVWRAADLLSKMHSLRETLLNSELPDDLNGAKLMLEEHNHFRKRVMRAPVEQIDLEGNRILERIVGSNRLNYHAGTRRPLIELSYKHRTRFLKLVLPSGQQNTCDI